MPCTAEKAAVCAASCAAPLLGYTHLRLHQDWARPPPRLRRDWAHPAHICKPQPRSRRTTASMPAHASAIASRRTRTGAARGSATRGSGWARDLKLFVRTGCGDDLPATVRVTAIQGRQRAREGSQPHTAWQKARPLWHKGVRPSGRRTFRAQPRRLVTPMRNTIRLRMGRMGPPGSLKDAETQVRARIWRACSRPTLAPRAFPNCTAATPIPPPAPAYDNLPYRWRANTTRGRHGIPRTARHPSRHGFSRTAWYHTCSTESRPAGSLGHL